MQTVRYLERQLFSCVRRNRAAQPHTGGDPGGTTRDSRGAAAHFGSHRRARGLEPYYKHILGTIEATESLLAPFPADKVGIVLDPPNFISPALYTNREEEMRRLFRTLGQRIHLAHFKDLKLNAAGQNVDLPGPGGGVMNYKLLASEIRSLKLPLPCIIEHIDTETATMQKTKSWVEDQIQMR